MHRPLFLVLVACGLAACSTPSTTLPPSVGAPSTSAPGATEAAGRPAPPPASSQIEAPTPIPFEQAVARAGQQLVAQARAQVGDESRSLVIDPLIDANTGAQTVGTVQMGSLLEAVVKRNSRQWSVQPLTRAALETKPLLLIGTLTPVTVQRSIDTPPDAFRVWLTMIDLRTGRIIGKQLDRSTVDTVNAEPLPFYRDSPTWHKDHTVLGYINSCQVNTNIGDPADPDYLGRLKAAAVVNEAIIAYGAGKVSVANNLYKEAAPIADPGDLRVLNGLYLTYWKLGQREQAKDAFGKLVDSGLELKRLPLKITFQPGTTSFNQAGDLPQHYQVWLSTLAERAGKSSSCLRIVGHTSRTGAAKGNELLSRQRAEAVKRILEQQNRTLGARLQVAGAGSRESLVGLGTDDQRDALDRRVEFRVVDCV